MRWSCGLRSSPRQYAPATLMSLNAEVPGRRDVRALAEVDHCPALAVRVEGELLARGDVVDDLELEVLADPREQRARVLARGLPAEGVSLHDLALALLDRRRGRRG